MLPLTLAWSPSPRTGRTLFVVFAYHGADRDGPAPARGLFAWIDPPPVRGHRIVHRDHYANPRRLSYLLGLIAAAAALLTPDGTPDLMLDERFADDLPADATSQFDRIGRARITDAESWRSGLLSEAGDYVNVVLVYSDALGLGCESGECAARRSASTVLIVNGRRRAFRLDRTMAARLSLSRFLARTRLVERLLAILIVPVANALGRIDRLRGAHHG